MLSDYLAASALIVDRLRDTVPGLRHVGAQTGLTALEQNTLAAPAVFVIYDGDRLGATAGYRAAQIVQQSWLVVLAVRNVADHASARNEAGELLAQILTALTGWEPSADHGPLVREPAPRPEYSPGFGVYPLAFSTAIETVASPN